LQASSTRTIMAGCRGARVTTQLARVARYFEKTRRGLVNTCGNSVYLPRGGNRGLGQCTSFRIRAEKIGDGEDLGAAGAFPSETYLAAPQIAVATAPLSQEAFSARRAFVHRLSDEPTFLTQPVGEMGGCRSVRLMAAKSERALAAGWSAIDAAALDRKGTAAHWACSPREMSVTAIVTHGDAVHAPTAAATGGASSRTNWPSRNWWPASSSRS
jgi:hypothetical protein